MQTLARSACRNIELHRRHRAFALRLFERYLERAPYAGDRGMSS